jgi:hypothetical protein
VNDNDAEIVPFKPHLVKVTPVGNGCVAPPNPAIISILKTYVTLAEKGHVQFMAMAYVDERGTAHSLWSPDDNLEKAMLTSALGAVSFLNARLLESALAGTANYDPEPEVG